MNVLVTGGGGFLGSYILKQLSERGYQTGSLARGDYPELNALGTVQHRGNLGDEDFVLKSAEGYDAIIHVAAKAGFWGSADAYKEPNITGTTHVLKACRSHGIKKLVFTSSPSVVFDGRAQSGSDETLPYPNRFESAYPESKAVSEQMVLAANSTELRTCALRPHLIFGPGDPHLLPKVIQRAFLGKLVQVGDGTNRVDLTYVEDAARAHLLALDKLVPGSPVCGSAYFISQDEPVVLWPWIKELLQKLEIPAPSRKLSLKTARTLGHLLEFIYGSFRLKGEPRLTRFLASELAKDHFYCIEKAKNELGYYPERNMTQALDKTLPDLISLIESWKN